MKTRVTFAISANFQTWAGGKKTAYEYVRHMDKTKFDVRILQPYPYGKRTISENELKEKLNGISIDYYIYPLDKLANSLNNSWLMLLFSNPLLPFRKIIFTVTRLVNLRKFRKIEAETDYFYLVNNDLAEILSNKSKIIGSEHIYLPGIYNGKPKRSISGKLALKLTEGNILYRNIDAFHCINESSKYFLETIKKSFFIPNGVDTSKYIPKNVSGQIINLLFVARLEQSKGILELLSAFKKIEDANFVLHVVGSGSLDHLFKTLNDERIIYHGFLTETELCELYGKCDVLVFPSYYETFGLVIIEALSCGLYVITSEQMRPRFDFFLENDSLEYVPIIDNRIKNSIIRLKDKIEYIRNFDRKQTLHEIVKSQYDWNDVVSDLSENILKV